LFLPLPFPPKILLQVVYSAPMDIKRKRPVMEVRKNKATMLRKQRHGGYHGRLVIGFDVFFFATAG